MNARPHPVQPSGAEIATFVDTFKRLDRFEAQQRTIRGTGIFKPEEVPVPAVEKVMRWLKELATE